MALGCTVAAALVVVAAVGIVFAAMFFESGAESGEVVLSARDAYAKGSIEHVRERNFYLVRLGDGSFLALADLDTANRASAQRPCRVAPLDPGDATLPALLARYGSAMSPQVAGSTLILRADCTGAVYDVTGVRLDRDGPNLDRFAVRIGEDGRVRVGLNKRTCSTRSETNLFGPLGCR